MKITATALQAIKDSLRLRNRLALEMDKHFSTIEKWVQTNEADGALTTASALRIIREETGMTDSEILTEQAAA